MKNKNVSPWVFFKCPWSKKDKVDEEYHNAHQSNQEQKNEQLLGPYETPLGEATARDIPVFVIFLLVLHYQFIVSVVGFWEVIGSREVVADYAEPGMARGMAVGGVWV